MNYKRVRKGIKFIQCISFKCWLEEVGITADVNMSSKMASFALNLHMNTLPALALMVMIFYNVAFCREGHTWC